MHLPFSKIVILMAIFLLPVRFAGMQAANQPQFSAQMQGTLPRAGAQNKTDISNWVKVGLDVEACAVKSTNDSLQIIIKKHTRNHPAINSKASVTFELNGQEYISFDGHLLHEKTVYEDARFSDSESLIHRAKEAVHYSWAVFLLSIEDLQFLSSSRITKAYISTDAGQERIWRIKPFFAKGLLPTESL